MWILVAMEYYIIWVETVILKQANGAAVANFISRQRHCWFDIPKCILSDIGTPFFNAHV